jgi:hypothetical protein
MSEREFWEAVARGIGQIIRGLTAISTAIARKYALGPKETMPTERR